MIGSAYPPLCPRSETLNILANIEIISILSEGLSALAENLFQMGVLLDFIKLLIWTGQLLDERPVSAIIVAPAGSGKTTILETLQCEQAAFLGDLTARPLSGIVRGSDKVTHILLGDMLSLFGHKDTTVKLTLRLVSQMTGEKILHDPWSGEAIQPRMIGLITAIPPEDFIKHRRHVKTGGFASRFLIAKYSYKAATVASIHRFISENRYANSLGKPFLMDNLGKFKVEISKDISERIKDFGMTIKDDPLGFRAHRHLRALVKAQARRMGRMAVKEEDFATIQSYCDFFSSDGKEI